MNEHDCLRPASLSDWKRSATWDTVEKWDAYVAMEYLYDFEWRKRGFLRSP